METFGVIEIEKGLHPFDSYNEPLYCVGFNREDECEPLCDEDMAFGANLSLKDYIEKIGEIVDGDPYQTLTYNYTTDYGHDLTDTYFKYKGDADKFVEYLNSLVA